MKVGDVVIKYTGGNKMTIEDIANDIVKCVWFVGSQYYRSEFKTDDLISIQCWNQKIERIRKIDSIM